MSIALRKLRDHYGDELVAPGRATLVLTPLAEQLKPMVREIVQRLDQAIALEPGFDPSTSQREFQLMAAEVAELTLVSDLVQQICPLAPQVEITCLPFSYGALARAPDSLDLILVPGRYALDSHCQEPLYTETFSCMAWEGNTRIGDMLTAADYAALPHATFARARASTGGNSINDALELAGVTRRVQVRTSFYSALPQMIVGTDLIATTYTRFARECARRMPIRVLKMPFETASLNIVAQWQAYRDNDPGLTWLRARLREAAARVSEQSAS